VQRGGAVVVGRLAARVDREAELQHQADRGRVAALGGGDQRRQLGRLEPADERAIGGGQAAGGVAGAADDRLEQPVDRIVARAADQLDGRRDAGRQRAAAGRPPVGARRVRVGAGGQQDGDRAAVGAGDRLGQRVGQQRGRAGRARSAAPGTSCRRRRRATRPASPSARARRGPAAGGRSARCCGSIRRS